LGKYLSLRLANIKAKLFGIIFILFGIGFFIAYFFYPNSLYLKIGFTSILLGTFVIFLLTEKSNSKETSNANIEGNLETIQKIIKDLRLEGNAIFLPRSSTLKEERILIPPNKTGIINIPNIDEDYVFLNGKDGKKLGISIPPSGLKLLKEIEKEEDFYKVDFENIEEKLQKFVGKNILKSISIKKQGNHWNLEIEQPIFCPHNQKLCVQYPCPTCSAVLTAISRSSSKTDNRLRINNVIHNGRKIKFNLAFIKKRNISGE
jgi:hypothetical protein